MAFQQQGPSWPPLPCQHSPANAHLTPGETKFASSGLTAGPPQPRSFAAAISQPRMLSRFPPILLAPRQVGSKEGFPAVSFSAEEVKAGAKRFEFSLVAKFSIGRPLLADIQKSFQAAWKINGRATISEVWDSRHILVILDSEQDVTTALASPGRKIGHSLFRLFRWSSDYNPRKESSTTTVWIRLPGLPLPLFDRAYIEPIVSGLGRYVDVDQRTKACLSLRFARVCVELDVSKVVPHKIWVNLPNNQGFWQEVKVESKLAYCARCRIHGHDLSVCRKEAASKEKGATKEGQNVSNNSNLQENNMTKSPAIQEGHVTKDDNNITITSKSGMNDPVREQEWQVVNRKKKGKGQREDVVRPMQGKGGNVFIDEHIDPTSAVVVFKAPNQEQEDDDISSKQNTSTVEQDANLVMGTEVPLSCPELDDTLKRKCPMATINSQDDKSMDPDTAVVACINQCEPDRSLGGNTPSHQIQEPPQVGETSEDIAAKYKKVPVTADKDNQVVRSQFLDDYIIWSKENGEFEDFLDYCKKQGFSHSYGSSITIEDSPRVDEDHIITHNSDYEACNQDDDNIRKPTPGKIRHRKKKGARSSNRSCPKQKDPNFVYP